ncbi:MAG: hypothetical protein J6X91_03610 [Bacteroidales bacterium]|nr:hypothetical protein [Bacteroidales bacterium]
MSTYHLAFNLENDGRWYIDLPSWPFAHHNLMMVAGADKLCEYAAKLQGRTNRAEIDVTVNDDRLDGKEPDIRMERFKRGYGASYYNYLKDGSSPKVVKDGKEIEVNTSWICPVTLFVLGRYPKTINAYIPIPASTTNNNTNIS